MIAKKVCLLGAFAVGKTSLVRRFVEGIFSEKYHTTIGVKIDKKAVECRGEEMQLLIWDIEGRDDFSSFKSSYVRGAGGLILVMDYTRPGSLDVAKEVLGEAQALLGQVPFVTLLNKADLMEERRIDSEQVKALEAQGWLVMESSAKTGQNVEEAFEALAERMLTMIESQAREG